MMTSEFSRFHNGLRILLNIDAERFPGPADEWPTFRDNPWRYFIMCPDETAQKLWEIIKQRNDDAERDAQRWRNRSDLMRLGQGK